MSGLDASFWIGFFIVMGFFIVPFLIVVAGIMSNNPDIIDDEPEWMRRHDKQN